MIIGANGRATVPAGADPPRPARRHALATLLGATRARVLEATETGCTTTGLSRTLAISAASASYHTTILRAAGLIETHRAGYAVRHEITALGAALLTGRLGGGRSAGAAPASEARTAADTPPRPRLPEEHPGR
ncbi:ArsR/SmtB family transcription factor [Amycolatopsis samaneae]|uniref:ArsR/SmtB family transcription factor n=1 Tax=Amycolatopsis samaneae TaxID=664691 RepID=A0ABW5GH84_9PSEU